MHQMSMKRDVRQALEYAFKKGFQVHPGAVEVLEEVGMERLDRIIRDVVREKMVDRNYHIDRDDLIKYLGLGDDEPIRDEYEILFDCATKITIPEEAVGYSSLFRSRYEKMRSMMQDRPESEKLRKIATIKTSSGDEGLYVCGLVVDKRVSDTAAKLVLEDPTGYLEGRVFGDARGVLEGLFLDQFVMAKVDVRNGVVFTDILLPDIPIHKVNRSESEAFAVLMSDLHIGSKYFLEKEFRAFLKWLSGPEPIARKVRFVLIAGDVVDGVGIFPGQEKELVYETIQKQMGKTADLLKEVPDHIKIFISPGNHDPGRRALPQPAIPKEDGADLWEYENIHMIGNPAVVSLNGVKVLMFHGQSIDDVVRTTGGMEYSHPANVMKHLLKGRHLSPIYGSQTPIAPGVEDLLVIDDVPDVFHAGHVHVTEISNYKDILVVNSGTWQSQTPFQVSVGQTPTPGLAVLLNLKTFKVYVKNFMDS